jgi:uncharacterized membrane protein YhhN
MLISQNKNNNRESAMPFIRPLWLSLFVISSLIYIGIRIWSPQPWDGLFKIIPILMLIQLTLTNTSGRLRILLIIALVCSLIGDALLSLEGLFIEGLGAFLLAQLTYTALFISQSTWQVRRLPWITAVLAYTGLCILFVLPHTGDMQLVITAYLCAITLMALSAMMREDKQFWWCATGAFLFMISDTLIAVNSFIQPFWGSGSAIMSTYYLAQLLITLGAIRHHIGNHRLPDQ